MPRTSGVVINIQKGQQGPATSIGDPSGYEHRINILPTRFAQQQHIRFNASHPVPLLLTLLFASLSASHRTETANLIDSMTNSEG
jgi:hypothetical protein